ncbi:MAG: GNAT family N-acetyltransferase [Deltaproteobacteria bacterium]|nr:GNAT family N-acetyltransferase [Deltaproteobacteria bacterium]
MGAPEIIPATAADRGRLGGLLSDAFAEDPLVLWTCRKDAKRDEGRLALYTAGFDEYLIRGIAQTTPEKTVCALWAPPGAAHLGLRGVLSYLPVVSRYGGPLRVPYLTAVQLRLERHHPREPHYYLYVLGVAPEAQGQGLGSAMLEHMHARIDAEGMPAYLETSTPRNLPLYERHGYRVREEVVLGRGAPPTWLMWREPRPSAGA